MLRLRSFQLSSGQRFAIYYRWLAYNVIHFVSSVFVWRHYIGKPMRVKPLDREIFHVTIRQSQGRYV